MGVERRQTEAKRRAAVRLDCAEAENRYLVVTSGAERDVLRRLAVDRVVMNPAPGIYARIDYVQSLSLEERVRHFACALAERHASWEFCLSTAALFYGLDVSHELLKRIHARTPRKITEGLADVVIRHSSPTGRYVEISGVRVSPFWETVAECMRIYSFEYALGIADSALKNKRVSKEEFCKKTEELVRGERGAKRARLVAKYADGKSDNGGESQLRAFFISHGYAIPELQVEFLDPTDGTHRFVVDYCWRLADGRIILGEFDGKGKYRDPEMTRGASSLEVMMAERQRESHLTLLGYPVLRMTYEDLRHPVRLERLLDGAGIPRDAEFEAAWRQQWRG